MDRLDLQEGSDGRVVVYPWTGWTYREGSDGRVVVYPWTGWTYTEGSDGRVVVYPWTGWTYREGSDGRVVAYPWTGWTYREGSDGRVVPYPNSGVGDIRLEILNEVWATDPDISSFTILEMMGYTNGDSINSSSSDYSRGYNDGYLKYDSDLQSFLLENYGKATVSEAVTAGIEAGLTIKSLPSPPTHPPTI